MQVLRTPEARFADITDFPIEPSYENIPDGADGELRVAYYEAGPQTGPPVALLHGEPSWGYLYRKVIPVLADAGYRVIVPDLVGFGRSDKPSGVEDHSYARHVEWIRSLLFDALALERITIVGQDWGGLIGLRLVAEHPDRFRAVVAANTGLPTGDIPMPEIWWQFRRAVEQAPELAIGRFVQSGCRTTLSAQTVAAYDAPFPDESYKSGPRAMPGLVPTSPTDPASEANRQAWATLTKLDIPMLVAFSDSDPITGGMAPILKSVMQGTAGINHPTISGAGHFLQEDRGRELGEAILEFLDLLPTS